MPYLLKALESDPFPRARMFAANGVAKVVGPGDAPEILKRFDQQDKATQMHLIIALVAVGDDEAYAGLSRLVRSPDHVIRFYVVDTIADHPNERALPILLDALEDEASEVRMFSMFGLEKLRLPESYPPVLASLDDENAYVRKEAAFTLGLLGNPAAVSHLIPRLSDSHYLVRCDAAESLGRLGNPQVIPALKPLLGEKSEAVRIKAAEALARLNDYSGMETLIDVTNSPVLLYRIEAREALRGISDEDFGSDWRAWSGWWQQNKESIIAKSITERES